MEEIRSRPSNGLLAASTFTGAGGSLLGFKMEGFHHVYASEFVPAARETFRANFPDVHLDERDIRQTSPEDVLRAAGVARGELDVLEGSPPCASFSTAGKRSRGWGKVKPYSDVKQRTDDLFDEYVRLLRGIRPRAFVAENVSGLVKGVAKGFFLEILRALQESGYRVECRVLDAQWLGVPQQRQRTIFVGFREDLGIDPAGAFPAPLPYRYSIRDAIPWIGGVVHDTSGEFSTGPVDVERDPVPAITVGVGGLNANHFKVSDAVVRVTDKARGRAFMKDKWGKKEWGPDEPLCPITANGLNGSGGEEIEIVGPPPPDAVGFDAATEKRRRRGGFRGKLSAEAPALTIQAEGIGGAGFHQAGVKTEIAFRSGWQKGESISIDDPAPVLMADGLGGSCFRQLDVRAPEANSLEGTAIGEELKNLRPGEQSERYFNLVRPHADDPCPTVTQTGGVRGAASVVHPSEPRKFTMVELRRLGGFPDDFVLTGTYRQQWERIGRAVPPVMMAAVARGVRDLLLAARK